LTASPTLMMGQRLIRGGKTIYVCQKDARLADVFFVWSGRKTLL